MERLNPYLKLLVIAISAVIISSIPEFTWMYLMDAYKNLGAGSEIGKEFVLHCATFIIVWGVSYTLSEKLFGKGWKAIAVTTYFIIVFLVAYMNTSFNVVSFTDLASYSLSPLAVLFGILVLYEFSKDAREVESKRSDVSVVERGKLDHNPSVIWGQER